MSTVEQVVVSIEDDIYAGIKYVADGVVEDCCAMTADIVDVAIAIGNVFVQLGEHRQVARSAEYHLPSRPGYRPAAQAIKATFAQMLSRLPSIILQGVETQVNGIFATVETDLTNGWRGIIAALDGTVTGSSAGWRRRRHRQSLPCRGMKRPHTHDLQRCAQKGTQAQSSQAVRPCGASTSCARTIPKPRPRQPVRPQRR
ncbi:MAG: hypothetical protein R2838_06245 [Caldilineaceae bacterium]